MLYYISQVNINIREIIWLGNQLGRLEIIPQMSTSAQICDTFMLVARLLLTPLIDRSQLGNKLTRNFMLLTQNVTTKTTSYYWNKTEKLVNITQC